MIKWVFLNSLNSLQISGLSRKRSPSLLRVWWLNCYLFDLPKLRSFTTEFNTFVETSAVTYKSILILILNDWFDLPQLTELSIGSYSFMNAETLTLEGLIIIIWFIWSSSIEIIHCWFLCIPESLNSHLKEFDC